MWARGPANKHVTHDLGGTDDLAHSLLIDTGRDIELLGALHPQKP